MKNFSRVLRIAARKRWSLAGIVLSSLVIAVLWGANIGTLYPLVEVVFKGESVPQYAAKKISENDAELARIGQELDSLKARLRDSEGESRRQLELKIESAQARQEVISDSVYYLKKLQPTINRYAPDGPYATLVLIVIFLTGGTALKLVALTVNLMLVQYVAEKVSLELRAVFFRKALTLDLDSFGENGSADLTSRLTNDIAHVSAGLTVLLGRVIREPLKMIVCLGGAMFVLSLIHI